MTREEWIKVRVTPAEKALAEERAKTEGLDLSTFIRRECGIAARKASRPERGADLDQTTAARIELAGRRRGRKSEREKLAEKARAALAR